MIIGNCSLALAPVRPGTEERVSEFLSYVEAIPMEVLRTVDFSWETVPQYMKTLDLHLGVNVGTLIGHSAVRHYVMGHESQGREATAAEIEAMRDIVRDAMQAGALGLSVSKNKGHTDPQGVLVLPSGRRRRRFLRWETSSENSVPASSREVAGVPQKLTTAS